MPDMRTCGRCAAENPAAAQFCMVCGARLARSCPNCGVSALPEARFCRACGTAIDVDAERPDGLAMPAAVGGPGTREAGGRTDGIAGDPAGEERRTVTVLFADLSGYTAIAERLDPEAVK